MDTTENPNKWFDWVENGISNGHINTYEYYQFYNIKDISSGTFGNVHRANKHNFSDYLILKSFFELNVSVIKEVVREIKFQHRFALCNENIIRFYGVIRRDGRFDNSKDYMLVMEYADNGTLRNYLKENFEKLTWNNKFNLAIQLVSAVSCLHSEGISHHDLYPKNVLVHQRTIKLGDFGLSKRIERSANLNKQSKSLEKIPFIDPIFFKNPFSLSKKSDVYSVGVILWEISSGQAPFKDRLHDIEFASSILEGTRETPAPNTSEDYVKIYTECWDNKPSNRPTIHQVMDKLKELKNNILQQSASEDQLPNQVANKLKIHRHNFLRESAPIANAHKHNILQQSTPIAKSKNILEDQLPKSNPDTANTSLNINNSVYVDLSKTSAPVGKNKNILEDQLSKSNPDTTDTTLNINNLVHEDSSKTKTIQNHTEMKMKKVEDQIIKEVSKMVDVLIFLPNSPEVKEAKKRKIVSYLKDYNLTLLEFYHWLLNNENNSNAIVLLGDFNYLGIGVDVNKQKAFELYQVAANLGNAYGMNNLGYCYRHGFGTFIDNQKAFRLFQKSATLGNSYGINNLANCYVDGIGINMDKQMGFRLYRMAAKLGNVSGINNLGSCYRFGIGTLVDNKKALDLYEEVAKLGYRKAQFNLALMYENGLGVYKDLNQAIFWYEKAAKQGLPDAQINLERIKKILNIQSNQIETISE